MHSITTPHIGTATRSLLGLAAAALLAGCAASSAYGDFLTDTACGHRIVDDERLQRELTQASPCCESLSTLPLTRVNADGSSPYGFSKQSAVYSFPSGKSHFVAFLLENSSGKFLTISPQISGQTTIVRDCKDFRFSAFIGDGSTWYRAIEPVVTFLDIHKKPLVQGASPMAPELGDYRVPIPVGATFAIVHTNPSIYGVQRRLRVHQNTAAVVIPGSPGALSIRGPDAVAAVVTSTGWFTVAITPRK